MLALFITQVVAVILKVADLWIGSVPWPVILIPAYLIGAVLIMAFAVLAVALKRGDDFKATAERMFGDL